MTIVSRSCVLSPTTLRPLSDHSHPFGFTPPPPVALYHQRQRGHRDEVLRRRAAGQLLAGPGLLRLIPASAWQQRTVLSNRQTPCTLVPLYLWLARLCAQARGGPQAALARPPVPARPTPTDKLVFGGRVDRVVQPAPISCAAADLGVWGRGGRAERPFPPNRRPLRQWYQACL